MEYRKVMLQERFRQAMKNTEPCVNCGDAHARFNEARGLWNCQRCWNFWDRIDGMKAQKEGM